MSVLDTIKGAALDYGKLFRLPDSTGAMSYCFRQASIVGSQVNIGFVDATGNNVTCLRLNQYYHVYSPVSLSSSSTTKEYLILNIMDPAIDNNIIPGFPSFISTTSFELATTIWVLRNISNTSENNYTFDVFNNDTSSPSIGITLTLIFPTGGSFNCESPENQVKSGLSPALIAAIVIIGIFIIVLIIVVIISLKKSSQPFITPPPPSFSSLSSTSPSTFPSLVNTVYPSSFSTSLSPSNTYPYSQTIQLT